jgi:hypothetical protein
MPSAVYHFVLRPPSQASLDSPPQASASLRTNPRPRPLFSCDFLRLYFTPPPHPTRPQADLQKQIQRERAMAEAEGRIKEARENEDVNRRAALLKYQEETRKGACVRVRVRVS